MLTRRQQIGAAWEAAAGTEDGSFSGRPIRTDWWLFTSENDLLTTTHAYEAIDGCGRRRRGLESAASAMALAVALESRGWLVLDVTRTESADSTAKQGGGVGRSRDVLEVTRALAALLPAGLPLARALATAAGLAGPEVQAALRDVQARVERGEPLAHALGEYSQFFSPLYVGLVRAGERSGNLAAAFERLAHQLERDEQLRGKLLSVLIYPILLAVAGGLAVLVLLFLVIPRFVDLLQDTGATLPRSTAFLLAVSTGLRRFWPVLLAIPVGLAGLVTWMRTTEDGQRAGSRFLLGAPLIGAFRRSALGARFARLLGTLLGGGAPLLSALDDTVECVGDPLAREEALRIRSRIREGLALHRALGETAFFPPLLAQLVTVGEESGQLQTFLQKAAEILEERTERSLQRLVALIEPAMIILFGGIVGFVALSLLQAIYSVNAGSFR